MNDRIEAIALKQDRTTAAVPVRKSTNGRTSYMTTTQDHATVADSVIPAGTAAAVLAPPAPVELSQSRIDQAATIDTLGRYAFGWSDSDSAGASASRSWTPLRCGNGGRPGSRRAISPSRSRAFPSTRTTSAG